VTRTEECVAAKMADAAQAGCRKEVRGQVETVGPLVVGSIHMISHSTRAVIACSVQVVITAYVDTVRWVERRRGACPRNQFIKHRAPAVQGAPVCAALEGPNPVELPSAQNGPSPSVGLPQERKVPNIVERQPLANVEGRIASVQFGHGEVSGNRIARSIAVGGYMAVVPTRTGIDRVAIGIVAAQQKSVAHLLLHREVWSVGDRISYISPGSEVAVIGIQCTERIDLKPIHDIAIDLTTQLAAKVIS